MTKGKTTMQEYKRQTENTHKIDLPSKIHTCFWRKHDGYPGEAINFEIITEFIAPGTEMKLRVTDKSGCVCDETDVEISGNKYCGCYTIPPESEESITLEVEIEEYGLKEISRELTIIQDVAINIINGTPKKDIVPDASYLYRLTTDTGDARIGKVHGKNVFVEKVNYIKEFDLEILSDEEAKEILGFTNYIKQYHGTITPNINNLTISPGSNAAK